MNGSATQTRTTAEVVARETVEAVSEQIGTASQTGETARLTDI